MPCPTCGHTMHGLGECDNESRRDNVKRAIAEMSLLLPDPKAPDWMPALGNSNRADARCLQGAFEYLHEALEEPESRHFWCPRCGTVRTVTGEHNADQPPKLVEAVKAADVYAGETVTVQIGNGAWIDVRRCIGRDR